MFYRPRTIEKMWDTWLFEREGVFFLFYLVTEHSPGEGICLATSTDGVHWHEVGLILPKSPESVWLGTGSVWPSERFAQDGLFVLNFSEWFGPEDTGQQKIFFATSPDLRVWTRLDEETDFSADARWYRVDEGQKSRWDCIYSIPRAGGGRLGYWTANPARRHPGFGFGESLDGLHWQALAPPVIEWGSRASPPVLEAGAVEFISGKFWMMAGSYEPYEGRIGMVTLVADSPYGPFHPAERNFFLLASPRWTAYFCRFFPTSDGLLVNHHVISRHDERAFAPLKRAVVDEHSTLRLHWWEGNEAVKGEQLPMATRFDPAKGVVIEGQFPLPVAEERVGFALSLDPQDESSPDEVGRRFALFLNADGSVDAGLFDARSGDFESEEHLDREVNFAGLVSFRLLLRGPWLELYLNDILMGCHNLPSTAQGEITFVSWRGASAWSEFTPAALQSWIMRFEPEIEE